MTKYEEPTLSSFFKQKINGVNFYHPLNDSAIELTDHISSGCSYLLESDIIKAEEFLEFVNKCPLNKKEVLHIVHSNFGNLKKEEETK